MAKKYGLCRIVGAGNQHFYMEFKYYRNPYSTSSFIVGKDVITKTKLIGPLSGTLAESDFEAGIEAREVKRNSLIPILINEVGRSEVLDVLEEMSQEELINYVNGIEEAKKLYKESIKNYRYQKIHNLSNVHAEEESINCERRRLRRILKENPHHN